MSRSERGAPLSLKGRTTECLIIHVSSILVFAVSCHTGPDLEPSESCGNEPIAFTGVNVEAHAIPL